MLPRLKLPRLLTVSVHREPLRAHSRAHHLVLVLLQFRAERVVLLNGVAEELLFESVEAVGEGAAASAGLVRADEPPDSVESVVRERAAASGRVLFY